MALPSSVPINLSQIKTEFGGGSPPNNLTAYYRGGSYVPSQASTNIPTSGTIKLQDFLGTSMPKLVYSQTTGQQYFFCSPYVYSGYIGSGSFSFATAGLGSMSNYSYSGATILALMWNAPYVGGNGGYYVQLTGNRATGFVNSVTISGTTRSFTTRTYDATNNVTNFGTPQSYVDGFGTSTVVYSLQ